MVGRYTNDIVYNRLATGILEELKRLNPVLPAGYRRNRHHQWFTPDFGHPKLKEHLAGVMALMRAAPNWGTFQRSLKRANPKMYEPCLSALRIHPLGVDCVRKMASGSILHVVCVCINRIGTI